MVRSTRPRKGVKRRRSERLGEEMFRDTSDTEGGRVKGRGEVVRSAFDGRGGRQSNVNCRVMSFGGIVKNFCEKKKRWVEDLGMGSLFHLVGKRLPRNLTYWIMTQVDPEREVFISSLGVEHPLCKAQVKWILGIPSGSYEVPSEVTGDEMEAFVEYLLSKFGDGGAKPSVCIKKVLKLVQGDCGDDDEGDFKIGFLIVALNYVLCPTSCKKFPVELVPSLFAVKRAAEYDWCGLVYEWFLSSARRFCKFFYNDGFAHGCGGCTYFIIIFYLDRLDRRPVKWDEYPRIKAWEQCDVAEAETADQLSTEPCYDYGKLGFLSVAYGDRHPKAPRDTMGPQCPPSLATEVATLVLTAMGVSSQQRNGIGLLNECLNAGGPSRKKRPRRKGRKCSSNSLRRPEAQNLEEGKFVGQEGPHHTSRESGISLSEKAAVLGKEVAGVKEGECIVGTVNVQEHAGDMNGLGTLTPDFKGSSYKTKVSDGHGDSGAVLFPPAPETDKTFEAHVEPDGCEGPSVSADCLNVVGDLNHDCDAQEAKKDGVEFVDHSGDDVGMEAETKQVEGDVGGPCKEQRKSSAVVDNAATTEETDNELVKPGEERREEAEGKKGKKVERSRCRRDLRSNTSLSEKEYEVDVGKRRCRTLKSQIVKYVRGAGAEAAEDNFLETVPVLIMVGQMFADLRDCYTLVSENTAGIRSSYVSMAAVLYTEMWRNKYGNGSSIRLMMDPSFADTALKEGGMPSTWKDTLKRCHVYAKKYPDTSALRFQVVFVPVLDDGHWWCVAVSVNSSQVWVMDSMGGRRPVQAHRRSIDKLCDAMDLFLKSVDPEWVEGMIKKWKRQEVMADVQQDGFSCGIRMLSCVKACADRCRSDFRLVNSVEEEREWLLVEDILADENGVRANVKALVKGWIKAKKEK